MSRIHHIGGKAIRVGNKVGRRASMEELANAGRYPLWARPGAEHLVADGARDFDDSGYFKKASTDFNVGSQAFYAHGWFTSKGNGTGEHADRLFSIGDPNDERFISVGNSTNSSPKQIFFETRGDQGGVLFLQTSYPSLDTFHFIELVIIPSTNEVKIAITSTNNTSRASYTTDTFSEGIKTSQDLEILFGANIGSTGGTLWQGLIDTFGIFIGNEADLPSTADKDWLFNGGGGRTPAEIIDHFDGTGFLNGHKCLYGCDEISGSDLYDALDLNDLTHFNENGNVGLTQGLLSGQPSTEQAAITKWESSLGTLGTGFEQSTSVNKPYTYEENGVLYLRFGGVNDWMRLQGNVVDWNKFLRHPHFFVVVMERVGGGDNSFILSRLDSGKDEYQLFFNTDDTYRFRYGVNGSELYSITSNNPQVNELAAFGLKVFKDSSGNVYGELWKNKTKLSMSVLADEGALMDDFSLGEKLALGVRDFSGSLDFHLNGKIREIACARNHGMFDPTVSEMMARHGLQ